MHDRAATLGNDAFENKSIVQDGKRAPARYVDPYRFGAAGRKARFQPAAIGHDDGVMSIGAQSAGEFYRTLVSRAGFDCRYRYQNDQRMRCNRLDPRFQAVRDPLPALPLPPP